MAEEAPGPTPEPIEDIEARAYRALVRSLTWLCKAEIWKYTKVEKWRGEQRDRILLARMPQKAALQLLEIRKASSITLARLLTSRVAVAVPKEVPAAGGNELEKIIDKLDEMQRFEDVDAEIKRLKREGEISEADAHALLQDAREQYGVDVVEEEEHTPEDELADLQEAALVQAKHEINTETPR